MNLFINLLLVYVVICHLAVCVANQLFDDSAFYKLQEYSFMSYLLHLPTIVFIVGYYGYLFGLLCV